MSIVLVEVEQPQRCQCSTPWCFNPSWGTRSFGPEACDDCRKLWWAPIADETEFLSWPDVQGCTLEEARDIFTEYGEWPPRARSKEEIGALVFARELAHFIQLG